LFTNHFANFITLFFNNGFPLIADTVNVFFTDFRDPNFFTNCSRWTLDLDFFYWPRMITTSPRTIRLPAARLTNTLGNYWTWNLTPLRFPVSPADLHCLRVMDWLTNGMTNITLSCFPHWLAYRVRNFLRSCLIHWFAYRVRNCSRSIFPNWLTHCVFDISKTLFFLVTNTFNFLLLRNFFTHGFITGVLLLFVDNILHETRPTA
jgi:hypothetical protein